MSSIILNVVIVLGIIIAGGFLIFFVGDLLLSIVDPKSDEKKIKNKRKKDAENMEAILAKTDPEVASMVKEDPKVAKTLSVLENKDESESDKAVISSGGTVETYIENTGELEDSKQEEDASEQEEDDDDQEERIRQAREALERRKQEILRRLQEDSDEDEEDDTEEEDSDKDSEDTEEVLDVSQEPEEAEEVVEDEVVDFTETEDFEPEESEIEQTELEEDASEPEEVEQEDFKDEADQLEEERIALANERERYQKLIQELQEKKNTLTMTASQVAAEANILSNKEEYEKKLAEKEESLLKNEKELKACRKEYMPLFKVQKTLEKDEKKLRIKEAQVAKQKVMLYGVNNYGDIDEEKAKKLSEELDLLDGLKLSVQHCREVMEENKDRLPILEKMYNFLENQNRELKNDIEYLKQIISKFEE